MKNLNSLMAAYLAVWAIFFVYQFTRLAAAGAPAGRSRTAEGEPEAMTLRSRAKSDRANETSAWRSA